MKEFLSRAGRQLVVKNVDEDDEAYDELVALGWRSVPITIVGNRTVRGYDEKQLSEALAALES